ncbi:MAG: hypothetical protein DHS20C01_21030 [marine bacterium B5-7]|nr:MAG: hypothetical protein DHS20C01_21030 [marine bacterium B5-7]
MPINGRTSPNRTRQDDDRLLFKLIMFTIPMLTSTAKLPEAETDVLLQASRVSIMKTLSKEPGITAAQKSA